MSSDVFGPPGQLEPGRDLRYIVIARCNPILGLRNTIGAEKDQTGLDLNEVRLALCQALLDPLLIRDRGD